MDNTADISLKDIFDKLDVLEEQMNKQSKATKALRRDMQEENTRIRRSLNSIESLPMPITPKIQHYGKEQSSAVNPRRVKLGSMG